MVEGSIGLEFRAYVGFSRNGKEHGNYYDGFSRDYYKDPFLHS